MFGLEDQKKKKKADEFIFDLEKNMRDPVQQKATIEKINHRIQSIREHLQGGIEKEDFDTVGKILYGYSALLKVVSRSSVQKK